MQKRIAILISNPETGGVERMLVHLAKGFVELGQEVALIVGSRDAPYLDGLPPQLEIVDLQTTDRSLALRRLCASLENMTPQILLAAKDEDCELAVAAKRRVPNPPRVFLRASVDYTGQLDGRRAGALRRWWRYRQVRGWFSGADALICVSHGVARDMSHILGRVPGRGQSQQPAQQVHVLPNPTVTPKLAALAAQPVNHPWFQPGEPPVVLGVGRLAPIKNFPLLVRAFARVRATRECRLVILGEGKHREMLLSAARELGIERSFDLPGFEATPYAYMAKAALFALSSSWEGFPNVLVEAMACGTPVVATDCPSGPREILRDGKLGALVPVGDEVALADAISNRLAQPRDSQRLQEGVSAFTIENSSRAYLRAFGLPE